MRRLVWGFAGRTYQIVGNLMHWLKYDDVYVAITGDEIEINYLDFPMDVYLHIRNSIHDQDHILFH